MSLTPYLAVADARSAITWYVDVLGAEDQGRIEMPDGRIGHAWLAIGDATLFLSDAHPEIGVVAPRPDGNDVTLHLEVDDVDGLVGKATEAGAVLDRPPGDTPNGRISVIRDPFGHRWMLNQR